MNPHGRTLPDRGERIIWINILLITAVPHLVNGRIKAVERIIRIRASGNSDVMPRSRGEGMHRFINPPTAQVIAKTLRQLTCDLQLHRLIKRALQRFRWWFF